MSSCRRLFEDSNAPNCETQNDSIPEHITVPENAKDLDTIKDNQAAAHGDYKDACTCCKHLFTRDRVRLFDESKYDVNNSVVQKVFSCRIHNARVPEVICKSCNQALCKDIPTLPRHMCDYQTKPLQRCIICSVEKNEKQTLEFNIENYNTDNTMLKRAFGADAQNISEGIICKQCDTKLMRYTLVTCALCNQNVKRYNALVLKETQHLNNLNNSGISKQWVCKPCNSTLVDAIKCVACDSTHPKHRTIKFHVSKYDMNDYIVHSTFCGAVNDTDHICLDCDRKLLTTNVCTCCHQKFNMYRVIKFDPGNYDFANYIVNRALA